MFVLIILQLFLIPILNCFLINFIECSDENIVTIDINNTKINGKRETTVDVKQVNIFRGIPYAEPPVGELRFKKPVPIKEWPKSIDAFELPSYCFQNFFVISSLEPKFKHNISEDCLYLNIISPIDETNGTVLKQVMFFFHGGAMTIGGSSMLLHQGDILSSIGDIVFVSCNYRLGTFGFLHTGTDEAPGNMGLWDQALALKWVNENIEHFGGDPKHITLFGQSAGSWSVSLHILSPVSRNLFKNAIMNSGAILNKIIHESPEKSINNWLKGAKLIGCSDPESEEKFTETIISCLKTKAPEELDSILYYPELNERALKFMTVVVVDGEFLPQKPNTMLSEGNFKQDLSGLMVSTVTDEGSMFLSMYDAIKYHPTYPEDFNHSQAYNELKVIASTILPNEAVNSEEVASLYFKELSDDSDVNVLRSTIGVAFGDYYLTCPTIEFAKMIFKYSNYKTNVYQFYYNNLIPGYENPAMITWAKIVHCAELTPIFGLPFRDHDRFTDDERVFSGFMIKLITDFAKTGIPTPINGEKWPKYFKSKNKIIAPYYEMKNEPIHKTKYSLDFKIKECEHLWRKYLE